MRAHAAPGGAGRAAVSAAPADAGSRPAGARRFPRAAMAGGITLTLLALAVTAGREAGEWLIVTRRVQTCGMMVVPGGGAAERLATAAELMSGGACGSILMTGRPDEEEGGHVSSFLTEIGAARIVNDPGISHSTWDDALIARRVAAQRGVRSILVVTSPYHTRRTAWAFDFVFAGSGIEVGFLPSAEFYMDSGRWWATRYGRRAVTGEYVKLFSYGAALSIFLDALAAKARPVS